MAKTNGDAPTPIEPLVSVAWLKEQLDQKRTDVVVLEASYDFNRDVKQEYLRSHIPGALFFNYKECRDVGSAYGPNMLPPPQDFAHYCGSIGLDNTMVSFLLWEIFLI